MSTKSKNQMTGMKWLRSRMNELGYKSLQEVADAMGINRGNVYRYFTLETRPSVDMLPVFCKALDAEGTEVLRALKVIKSNQSLG